MTSVLCWMHRVREQTDHRMEVLMERHPLAAFVTMFILMPALLLAAVFVMTILVVFPAACIMGWL